jgi:hypothetical protein
MRLLILLALCLLPLSAQASGFDNLPPSPSLFSQSSGVTVLHPAPGVDTLWDQHSNHVTILDTGTPGTKWYSQQDPTGRITSQG